MLRLPPLAAIEAFVTAMEADSFTVAADRLALSPSALGRRVRTLEQHLGVTLFDRSSGRPRSTLAAQSYFSEVRPSLEALDAATLAVRGDTTPAALRVLVAPSLAAEWLMPQLATALCERDGVRIEVGPPGCTLDPIRHDVAILAQRTGTDDRPSDRLAPVFGAVVAGATLADEQHLPRAPDELGPYKRLDLRFPEALWRLWSEVSGAPMPGRRGAERFDSTATMYEAAAAGFGLALGVPLVSERRLRSNDLRVCFPGATPLGFEYRIVYRDTRTRRRPDVARVASSLVEAAERSFAEFRVLAA